MNTKDRADQELLVMGMAWDPLNSVQLFSPRFFLSGESVWHHLSLICGGWMGNGEPFTTRDFHLGWQMSPVIICGA